MVGRADPTEFDEESAGDPGPSAQDSAGQVSTVQSLDDWPRAADRAAKNGRRRRSLVDYPEFVEQLAVVDAQPKLVTAEWAEELDDPDRVFEPIWPTVATHRGYFTIFEQVTLILLALLGAAAAAFLWHDALARLL